MGISNSSPINFTNGVNQGFYRLVCSSISAVRSFAKESSPPNELHSPGTNPSNESNQVKLGSVHVPNEPSRSLADGSTLPVDPIQTRTESVDAYQVLRQAEVKQFSFSGKVYCRRVWAFRDPYYHYEVVLPNDVSLYMFDREEITHQSPEVFGMVIDTPHFIGLAPNGSSPILDAITSALNSSLGEKLTFLVLHRVTLPYDLVGLFDSLKLEVLHLHRISFCNGIKNSCLVPLLQDFEKTPYYS